MNNVQTFSRNSDQYAKHRPQYPDELFNYLSDLSPSRASAWDCATGNGQAAVSLAKHFERVEATDLSAEQLAHATPHPKVQYSIAPAEQTPFRDQSFDLVTVATAVHWFDQEKFHREVGRVLKPNGILAVWTYGNFTIDPEIDRIIGSELLEPIDRFWASGNRTAMNGYRDLPMPFEEVRTPSFSIQMDWTLEQFAAYMRTWSAVKRFTAELGVDPVIETKRKLGPTWGEPEKTRTVYMPLFVKASKKPA
jgi:ubiquinone/menaquinone biosynthesis C-methylase UbiE